MAALQRHSQAQLRTGVTHTTIGLSPAAADGTVASVRLGSRTVSITYSELVHTGVVADRVPLPVTPDAVTCHPTAGLSLSPSIRAHVTHWDEPAMWPRCNAHNRHGPLAPKQRLCCLNHAHCMATLCTRRSCSSVLKTYRAAGGAGCKGQRQRPAEGAAEAGLHCCII